MLPNYARPPFQEPNFKQGKVAAKLAHVKKQIEAVNVEDGAKAAAKLRDKKRCRWPHTKPEEREMCRRSRWLEAMHWKSKGMGGSKDGARNVRRNIITGCPLTHQGPGSIHAGGKRIVPLDPKLLMDGPCQFEEKISGRWVIVGIESHVGILTKLPGDPQMERD